jgi:hypothetical protein
MSLTEVSGDAVITLLVADLDQLLFQARQRPLLDRLGQSQRPHEVGEIIGQRMQLKPDSVGCKRSA